MPINTRPPATHPTKRFPELERRAMKISTRPSDNASLFLQR
jgi:hypothetical protein